MIYITVVHLLAVFCITKAIDPLSGEEITPRAEQTSSHLRFVFSSFFIYFSCTTARWI